MAIHLRQAASRRGQVRRLSWLVLFALAACSPYSFPKETAAISTGVDQVSAGFEAAYAGLASDEAAKAQLDLTEDRARVAIPRSCVEPQNPLPCALYRFGGPPPAPSDVEKTRGQTMEVLAALKDYAHALAAVTNAADRAAYDAAVAQLSAAVGAIAQSANAVAPGAGVVAPAAVNLIGWLVGTGLDQQRFDSLRAAVNVVGKPGADGVKPIHSIAATLGIGLQTISAARQQVLYEETNVLVSGLGPSLGDAAYRQRLSAAQAQLAMLDGLRRSDPTGTAQALETAHDALVAAVNDPSRSYPGLLKALSDFKAKAEALQTAFAATSAAPSATTKQE